MALGLLSLISIATPAPALDAATKALSIGEWEALWTKVLTRYVDESGRIDFDALSQNHADLDRVVAFMRRLTPIPNHSSFRTSNRISPSISMRTMPWQCTVSLQPVSRKASAA